MTYSTTEFDNQLNWIKNFTSKSNTTKTDWYRYNFIVRQLGEMADLISDDQKNQLHKAFGPVMTTATLQGFAFVKPHGYAGDYEMIDKLYTFHTSADKHLAKWDKYMHSIAAAKAVRNRKTYVKKILGEKVKSHYNKRPFTVLNLASGPGRDMFEFFKENHDTNMMIDCIELDKNAIEYASKLLAQFEHKVKFINENVLRMTSEKQYDLVWSAGLFDYFNDSVFKKLIKRFLNNVMPGGELIVGNFCTSNPDINYMKLLNWHLYHRNENELRQLVMQCGVQSKDIVVEKEPEGVNLFVRIKKSLVLN